MQRINWIDGLKGICALIVVLSHLCAAFKYACPAISEFRVTPVLELVVNGNLAVYIFIMLSTMLMYGRSLDGKISLTKVGSIIRKRYFRLTLPIAVVFVIAILLKLCGMFYHTTLGEVYGFDWLLIDTQEYTSFLLGIFLSALGNSCGWFNIMWMMQYIFMGSLFALCLGIGIREEGILKRNCYILLFLSLSYFIDQYYCAVFAGCILYEYMYFLNEKSSMTSIQNVAKVLSIIIMGGALFVGEYYFPKEIVSFKNFFESIAFIGLMVAFPKCQHVLSYQVFSWLGKISYEIFLVHLLVIYSISSYLYLQLPCFSGEMFLIAFISIAITLSAAWIFSKYITPKLNLFTIKYT